MAARPPRSRSAPAPAPAPTAPSPARLRAIRRGLVAWFRAGHRPLPWRESRDPYAIWISEIMCQQTQVDTVVPYWTRWMARFPTVRALAEAPLEDVLASWTGLGYYARARNLHAAAAAIVSLHGGAFPDDPEAVRALPGVGPYTAGAILSIAFDRPAPILDGNVARVLARLFCVAGPPDAPATRRALWALAATLVPEQDASAFNQGLMELGATVCTPRSPTCGRCPLTRACEAHAGERVLDFPAPKRRRPPREVEVAAVLLEHGSAVLLARRPPRGLWGGLWEPPVVDLPTEGPHPLGLQTDGGAGATRAAAAFVAALGVRRGGAPESLPSFTHVLSHRIMRFYPRRISLSAVPSRLRAPPGYEAVRWVGRHEAGKTLGVAAWTARLLGGTVSP